MRTVFTNGCFDLLHAGHVDYLRRCRSLGDWLVVAINTDASVQRLKGPTRPVYAQWDRLAMVAALKYVSEVHFFDSEEELAALIAKAQPTVLIKGEDYRDKPITGAEHAERVALLPLLPGYSTSATIARLRQ
jgi:D-beta-D-heptose 7-phosphate kinase/D-beta-D-heptose 1-phosphate adenosyltransferase